MFNSVLRAGTRHNLPSRISSLSSRSSSATRSLSTKVTLPSLPYSYGDLEPVISGEIMELHHSKHHNAYVTNYNLALEKLEESTAKGDVTGIIAAQAAINFNGGGHINHSIFWENLTNPKDAEAPSDSGAIEAAIEKEFGSKDNLQKQLSAMSVGVQGSGWGWLGFDTKTQSLQLATCKNQDPLLATTGLIPLFGIDVWEHAYYLQYKNVRPDYVNAIWKLVNWKDVGKRYDDAKN